MYIDAFSTAVDKDEHLADIQKMQYLNIQLKDEAANTIEDLQLTRLNYKYPSICYLKGTDINPRSPALVST